MISDAENSGMHSDKINEYLNNKKTSVQGGGQDRICLLYTSPSPRD